MAQGLKILSYTNDRPKPPRVWIDKRGRAWVIYLRSSSPTSKQTETSREELNERFPGIPIYSDKVGASKFDASNPRKHIPRKLRHVISLLKGHSAKEKRIGIIPSGKHNAISRLARNFQAAEYIWNEVDSIGAKIVNLATGKTYSKKRFLKEARDAEREWKRIVPPTKPGRHERYGPWPLGVKSANRIDENFRIVASIFALTSLGLNRSEIADVFNKNGIRGAKELKAKTKKRIPTKWQSTSVKRTLDRMAYRQIFDLLQRGKSVGKLKFLKPLPLAFLTSYKIDKRKYKALDFGASAIAV